MWFYLTYINKNIPLVRHVLIGFLLFFTPCFLVGKTFGVIIELEVVVFNEFLSVGDGVLLFSDLSLEL
jgi:hypothetical protein